MADRTETVNEIVAAIRKITRALGRQRVQMFDCVGMMPDEKITIYRSPDHRICVLWCSSWEYVEVLGLSDDDYQEVFKIIGE